MHGYQDTMHSSLVVTSTLIHPLSRIDIASGNWLSITLDEHYDALELEGTDGLGAHRMLTLSKQFHLLSPLQVDS